MPDPTMTTDPIWNEPPPVTVAGHSYVFREIPFLNLRKHVQAILGALTELDAANPTLFSGAAELRPDLLAAIVGEGSALDGVIGALEAVARESTQEPTVGAGSMPASAWIEVASRALEAQLPTIRAFLAVGERWRGHLALFRPDGAMPSLSSPSPAPASAGATSGG